MAKVGDALRVEVDGDVPGFSMTRGDTANLSLTDDTGTTVMRVFVRVLDDDERWPTPVLARLEAWLEAHGLDRAHGLELLKMMNGGT